MDIAFIISLLLWPLCLFIIGLILLQGGAGDLSSAFGGGGQLDSTLGVGAGRKMSKLTGWLAFIFLASIIFLARPHEIGLKKGLGDSADQTTTMSTPAPTPTAPPVQGTVGDEVKVGDHKPVEAVVEIPPDRPAANGEKPADVKPVEPTLQGAPDQAQPKEAPAPAAAPAEATKPPETSSKPVLLDEPKKGK